MLVDIGAAGFDTTVNTAVSISNSTWSRNIGGAAIVTIAGIFYNASVVVSQSRFFGNTAAGAGVLRFNF